MRWIGTLVLVMLVLTCGCANNTESPQKADQTVITPASNDQNQSTSGGHVFTIDVGNHSKGGGGKTATATQPADSLTSNITIFTGNVTPNQSGSLTPSSAGTNTPQMSAKLTSTQDVRPELSFSIPLAFGMPGSIIDQQATSTGRGSTSGTSKESSNDLKWSQLIATARGAGVEDMMLQIVQSWLAGTFQAAQPAVKPGATKPQ